MQIGRRIYYDKTNGNVIQDTGERRGNVVETTIEQDFAAYVALAERVPETVGVLQMDYGQYAQDFAECNGYRVDVSGDEPRLLFSYPDLEEPEAPPVYRGPFSVEVDRLKQADLDNKEAVAALYEALIGGGTSERSYR
ncbi:hypothetical protein DUZ99_01930 [Xylanibacillus composti]|uniref:Uncharacterized protein n=1 Tax=Xylanibacillus composti TaxID=1572762 RepID=A0A8J4H8B0_9BACL|nr:hypothetical protein [Xylanibacillus composti]MDT9723753.1 hypothetical protein [Xylanibacillus composti]GIQ70778.1 hypothetical protein XYCOK13_36020 [Xylanibacillus composti]